MFKKTFIVILTRFNVYKGKIKKSIWNTYFFIIKKEQAEGIPTENF